jgi:hypothetical protein
MPHDSESPNDLQHELANSEAKVRAAQHLLKRAAEEIEDLVEGDCADEQKTIASQAAERFREAASL